MRVSWDRWQRTIFSRFLPRAHHYPPQNDLTRMMRRCYAKKSLTKESIELIRNIGIIAHVDAGKTTTCERMLFYTGETRRVGDVDQGDTVMDYLDLERERGITINSAAISMSWRKHTINVIDTPGHVDFTVEVERAVRVLDGAVTILDAVSGVQAQTETVWRQVSRFIYVNKMDREGASLQGVLGSIQSRLYVDPIPIQLPIGSYRNFSSVVDLVTMELIEWSSDEFGANVTRTPVDQTNLYDTALAARAQMIEKIANYDDHIMELFFNLESEAASSISSQDLQAALRRITLQRKAAVVMCGSSLRNKGVQSVLDGIIDYLPSPNEAPGLVATNSKDELVKLVPSSTAELAALIFKVVHDPRHGLMMYLRVYAGTLHQGEKLLNPRTGTEIRVMKLVRIVAEDIEEIKEVSTGGIAAIVGAKESRTGDTLIRPRAPAIMFERLKIPEPVFSCSVMAESAVDEKALKEVLDNIQAEDPSVKVSHNIETGQTTISTMGELHLEIVQDRILNHYKVKAAFGNVFIAYRSTLSRQVDITHSASFLSNSGNREELEFTIRLIPGNEQPQCNFQLSKEVTAYLTSINNKVFMNDTIMALQDAAKEAFTTGFPPGFPFHCVTIELRGLQIQVGTTSHSIKIGFIQCVQKAAEQAGVVILEPVMKLEIEVDSTHVRQVMNDLSHKRRGSVLEFSQENHLKRLLAKAPLKEMLGYSSDLRSFTKGTGFFTMEFHDYEEPSEKIQNEILTEHGHHRFLI